MGKNIARANVGKFLKKKTLADELCEGLSYPEPGRSSYLSFEFVTPDILREFEAFLRQEHTIFKIDEETRTPKQRGQNTINDLFTKLCTFFRWAVESGRHRIIRSLISQFRNVFMVRHTTLLLKKGISYIIPILTITQP